jgi:hypothetical protein
MGLSTRVIIASDWYNAIYEDGKRKDQGKPEYLDAETMARIFPDADIYYVEDELYDDVLDGAGYPEKLEDFPLDRAEKLR